MKKLIIGVLLLLMSTCSFAYKLYGIKWMSSGYYYYINPISVDLGDNYGSKSGMITSSAGAWDGVSTSTLTTQFLSTTTDTSWSGSDPRNNINTITWKEDGWSGAVIGVAAVWSSGGQIIEADIKLNTAFANDSRVGRLIEHEVGHALGIAHSREQGDAYTTEEYNAIMYWQLHSQEGFNCQDRCAISAIYPDGTCDAEYGAGYYACLPCCGGYNVAPSTSSHSFSVSPAFVDSVVTCSVTASDADGHDVKVKLDWGDGTITEYSALATSGSTFDFDHSFSATGDFDVQARVQDEYGMEDDWTLLSSLGVSDALPVELALFSANAVKEGVEFYWVTESEQINLGFILERKYAGEEWQQIAGYQTDEQLRGQGTTTRRTEYSYIDKDAQSTGHLFYRLSDVSMNGERNVIAEIQVMQQEAVATPLTFAVQPAYPNPFNPTTRIQYQIPKSALVQIQVFSITGKLVDTLRETQQEAGYYDVEWQASSFPSGIYLVRMNAGGYSHIQRIVLLK